MSDKIEEAISEVVTEAIAEAQAEEAQAETVEALTETVETLTETVSDLAETITEQAAEQSTAEPEPTTALLLSQMNSTLAEIKTLLTKPEAPEEDLGAPLPIELPTVQTNVEIPTEQRSGLARFLLG